MLVSFPNPVEQPVGLVGSVPLCIPQDISGASGRTQRVMVLLATMTEAEYVEKHISPTLTKALVALAKARPVNPRTFLAHYLLNNKPPATVQPQASALAGGGRSFEADPTLTPAQRQAVDHMMQQFQQFDTDGSGDLDCRELGTLLSTAGLVVTKADVARLLAQYDEDNSGTLSSAEFQILAKRELALSGELAAYAAAFKAVDADGSGEIDLNELRALLMRLGHPSDPAELFAKYDADGSGKLTFDEFMEVVKAGLVDVAELRAAFADAGALADTEVAYEAQSEADAYNPPGHMVEAMCALIQQNAVDVDGLRGNDDAETETIQAVLVKVMGRR